MSLSMTWNKILNLRFVPQMFSLSATLSHAACVLMHACVSPTNCLTLPA
jgi:hypothetical protein